MKFVSQGEYGAEELPLEEMFSLLRCFIIRFTIFNCTVPRCPYAGGPFITSVCGFTYGQPDFTSFFVFSSVAPIGQNVATNGITNFW
jgi:hypothetical protein